MLTLNFTENIPYSSQNEFISRNFFKSDISKIHKINIIFVIALLNLNLFQFPLFVLIFRQIHNEIENPNFNPKNPYLKQFIIFLRISAANIRAHCSRGRSRIDVGPGGPTGRRGWHFSTANLISRNFHEFFENSHDFT